jgi:hypothetical protein
MRIKIRIMILTGLSGYLPVTLCSSWRDVEYDFGDPARERER